MEILMRVEEADEQNVDQLCEVQEAYFGSSEDAITAAHTYFSFSTESTQALLTAVYADREDVWRAVMEAVLQDLAANGCIVDSGERRRGQIVWKRGPNRLPYDDEPPMAAPNKRLMT